MVRTIVSEQTTASTVVELSVEVKRFPVHFAIHFRVGQEDFRGATLGHNRQHPRLFELFDGLRCQDHRGIVLAPGLLCLHHVIADRLVLDEEPRLVEQEDLEVASFCGSAISFDARCKT